MRNDLEHSRCRSPAARHADGSSRHLDYMTLDKGSASGLCSAPSLCSASGLCSAFVQCSALCAAPLNMYVYVSMYVCKCVCMHACMHACMYVCMYVCMYTCTCMLETCMYRRH